MGFVNFLLVMIEVITCLLLIGAILIQRSKSHGAGLAFGAGMGETIFGSQAGNVLTRITVILAIIFFLNTVALAFISQHKNYPKPKQKSVPQQQASASSQPVQDRPLAQPPMNQPVSQDSSIPATQPVNTPPNIPGQ